ncbi:hypothetical protein NC651_026432 [Populus alba x Populus x berolinensis]|nr:hypothetical protein NC651_026432 [Populus alba x Populus x berolinensis]
MAGARRLMTYNGAKVSRGFVSRPIPKRGQLKVGCPETGLVDEFFSPESEVEWKGLKNHVAPGTVIDPVLESGLSILLSDINTASPFKLPGQCLEPSCLQKIPSSLVYSMRKN